MSFFEITGRRRLSGSLTVQGAKNSALPILAACVLAGGESIIHNCPKLSDVSTALEILEVLGCRCRREGDTVAVDAAALTGSTIPEHLMREMRSSVVFLGPLLARLGEAELSYPGGCELGPRPIDLHLAALRALGAEIREEAGTLFCRTEQGGLKGRRLCLSFPSVGATENAMLAACGCSGVTEIVGAAQEPEIVDLQCFLQALGADVQGAGQGQITVRGGRPLHPAEHTVIPDRIAAATYLTAAGAAGGDIQLLGVCPEHLACVLDRLEEAGCRVAAEDGTVRLSSAGRLRGIRPIRTAPYPGFPTDAQALLMAALAGGEGTTVFVEDMFDSRYRHAAELARMGADIQLSGRVAVVTGTPLHGARVACTDLRGGAALVAAALAAEGVTRVTELQHIDRGYDHLEESLRLLGADIIRMS